MAEPVSRAKANGTFYTLQRKPALKVWQSLLLRAGLVLSLIGVALAGHWIDRDGLRDNIDAHISFSDVVYFTAITVTTVGYGDIVPVSDRARMFDTFVVTPVRIFVWLIFLGSAYDFMFKRVLQRIRTAMIRKNLTGHTIICGFGAKGEHAARELLLGGESPNQIVVVDPDPSRIAAAVSLGLLGVQADATQNDALKAARIAEAATVLIATSRDDVAALTVLSARQLNPHVPISVTARAQENEDLLTQAGATCVLNPVRIGGHMLARAGSQRSAVAYLADLASSEGEVLLIERDARPEEFGQPLTSLPSGLGLRLLRNGSAVAGPRATQIIAQGDVVIEIVTGEPARPG